MLGNVRKDFIHIVINISSEFWQLFYEFIPVYLVRASKLCTYQGQSHIDP